MQKKALVLSLCLTIGVAVFLLFRMIDTGITLTYVEAGLRADHEMMDQLELLLEDEWRGVAKQELVSKLRQFPVKHPGQEAIINEPEDYKDTILFNGIPLRFESGKLKSIGRKLLTSGDSDLTP